MFRSVIRNRVLVRQLQHCRVLMKAEAFGMPAMSPTMEKGGIVDWKFKVGEPFSAGDVILEVETDKATIDVEAQDDGKFAKILKENGAKDVPVGETIAYIAEVDDDLATLELPEGSSTPKKEAAAPAAAPASTPAPKKEEPKAAPKAESSKTAASSSNGTSANTSQTFFPSVATLLQENSISPEEAFAKIKATGPNGRILKGDVLAYLGKISQESLDKVTSYIKSHEKLDLSNIELRKEQPAAEQPATASSEATQAAAAAAEARQPLVLSEQITLRVPVSVSYEQLAEAVRSYVKESTFLAHEEPLTNSASDLYDPLFEELLVQEPHKPRFKVTYNLVSVDDAPAASHHYHPDIFELLAGTTNSASSNNTTAAASPAQADARHEYVLNVSVAVDESLSDAKERAESFVSRISSLELF
ncbi:pyruvate dehydrogenase complex protein X component [Kluyveromyces marxianus]|uniref:Pyruvate dehydrogenase complex protein X component n=1 Tax=Kluyveromyces marxianus TaxID=4911 RepID=A0ABX6EZX2_KLUMA|nr:pyruvate dehydrogenase complex protein X component [Kluyveromyces marxianus]